MVKFPFKLQLKFFSFVVKIPQLCVKDISHKKKFAQDFTSVFNTFNGENHDNRTQNTLLKTLQCAKKIFVSN